MPHPLRILISGGGIAGPCLAYWLKRASPTLTTQITIIERAPSPRTSGQAVDIRDAAVTVIQRMGLEQAIRDKTTTETGVDVVYADGVTKARFEATGDTSSQSFTSEFEILRGDLAEIFLEATKGTEGVEYIFGESVAGVRQEEGSGKVKVSFANGLEEKEFDVLVGADGMISKVRRLVWGRGPGGNEYMKRLGQYMSFFTIPKEEGDDNFSQWYFAPKGCMAVTRPSAYNDTRGLLAVTDGDLTRFDGIMKAMKEGPEKQKEWLAQQFEGAGWITERLVREMMKTDEFYIQETAQVRMGEDGWVKGRVALLGDAGSCPSPISGMGTSSALVGAYILAGEISKSPDDVPKALQGYQNTSRPYVDKCQKLFPGAPNSVMPKSEFGVKVLNMFTTIASNSWVKRLGGLVGGLVPKALFGGTWELPKYDAFK